MHVPGVPSVYKSAWSSISGLVMLVRMYWLLWALVLGVLHEQELTSTHPSSLHYYVFLGSLFHLLTNFYVYPAERFIVTHCTAAMNFSLVQLLQ